MRDFLPNHELKAIQQQQFPLSTLPNSPYGRLDSCLPQMELFCRIEERTEFECFVFNNRHHTQISCTSRLTVQCIHSPTKQTCKYSRFCRVRIHKYMGNTRSTCRLPWIHRRSCPRIEEVLSISFALSF